MFLTGIPGNSDEAGPEKYFLGLLLRDSFGDETS